jgi:hypothetical protein
MEGEGREERAPKRRRQWGRQTHMIWGEVKRSTHSLQPRHFPHAKPYTTTEKNASARALA